MWGNFFFFVNEKPQAVSGKRSLFFYPQQGKECFTYATILRAFANVNPKLADNCGDSSWRKAANASRQFGVSRVGTRHRPHSWEAPPALSFLRCAKGRCNMDGNGAATTVLSFRLFQAFWGNFDISVGMGVDFSLRNVEGFLEKFPIPLKQSWWCSKFGENCKVANGSKEGV